MSIDTDIQSWPEVPSIAHFCSLFRQAFDLLEFEIQELEESLLLMGTPDDELRLVHRLMVKLLIGCLPMYKKNIKEENYSMYLRQFLQTKQEEAEEDGIEYRFMNPFQEEDMQDFSELDLRDKVRVLHQLCEVRLEAADVADKVKKLEAASLRVDPLGTDSEGTTFWYFYGTRLYQEVPAQATARSPNKSKDRKKKRKEKKEKKRKRKRSETDLSDEESDGGDSIWSLACLTEDDWIELTEKYKKSRKKEDRNLYHTLNDAFLPEITTMFAEKEREEKQKLLMMAPKRTSTRIEKLKKTQEEKDRALALFLEEENRLELLGKSRRTRYTDDDVDSSADIEKEREERARQREMMKEMRAKRAAERLIQTEFSDDVSKQRELMRSKHNEMSTMKEERNNIKLSPKKDDDKKRKSNLSSKKETSPLDKDNETSHLSRKRKDSFDSSSPSEDDISTRDNSPYLSDRDDDVSYRPPTKSQSARNTFTNALIKAGTKSTKDSTLEKPVRKTAGLLLQTAGKGLLNKVANKRLSAFDALLNSGPGPSASAGISFGLYGGYLPIDPGTSSANLGSVFDEKIYSQENSGKNEEPTRKVFSNWGGEFFKKNLDFRTNTNKILEKMQLGKPTFGEVANGTSKSNSGGTRLS